MVAEKELSGKERAFAALGTWITRHPYYPLIAWVILLIVAVPTLSNLGSATTNSATVLPNNAPSIVAANEIAALFPSQNTASSSIIVLDGPNITGPAGQASTVAVTRAIQSNRSIQYLATISDLYDTYAEYLAGQTELTLAVLANSTQGPDSLYSALNDTALLLWTPPATYAQSWYAVREANPSANGSQVNWDAYLQANYSLSAYTNATVHATLVRGLSIYYAAFNTTPSCAGEAGLYPLFLACSDNLARQSLGPVALSGGLPLVSPQLAGPALSGVGIENFTQVPAVRGLTARVIASQTGLSAPWVLSVWMTFPSGGTSATVSAWANRTADTTPVADYPLPIPLSLERSFVSPDGELTLIAISYTQQDAYTAPDGSQPIFNNIDTMDQILGSVLHRTDPAGGISYYQTGVAPLDKDENSVLSGGLVLTLPLSVSVLLLITALYFRSPVTPLVAFGPIAMALIIAMGGTYLIGTMITRVDVTSLELQDAFVLGVGTDYAVFLFSRYREELAHGKEHKQAVIATMTWAGESIAISGATVILSTLALAFSGVALLSEWGMVLSLSVFIALLISLTVVPALIVLLGPRVFWPDRKERMVRREEVREQRAETGQTYFQKAGRYAVKHAVPIVLVAALVSMPLSYIAFTAPVTYDYFGQLPANSPSSQGLQVISDHFGPGYVFPLDVLVTFNAPLITNGHESPGEFQAIANVTALLNATPGIAYVDSPTGPYGAPLSSWLSYSSLGPVQQVELNATLSPYVGTDGRSILFTVVPSTGGLSLSTIQALSSVEDRLGAYAQSHPGIQAVYYGGAASELKDLDFQTSQALDRMITIVVIGLIVVLLALLASLTIPLMAVVTIGVSIAWAWAVTYLVMAVALSTPIFFFDRVILFIIVLGLGMDYNVFILTRIREEKSAGIPTREAVVKAVGYTGGIITAAAIILASVFFVLASSSFALLRTIGFSLGVAVILDAMIVRTFLMPALISILGERVWWLPGRRKRVPSPAKV